MIFAPLDAGLYGLYLSKHGTAVAALMAQDLLSNGDDPKQMLADVRDLLSDIDRVMSEGSLDDQDWENLRIEWCLTSPTLLNHLQEAEEMLDQIPCMKVPALVILCNVSIFLNSRRTTFDLNNMSISEVVA
ncbi:MAG: hypothetical protein IPK84_02215 [Candidatus Moraniibacteriota bacterium]|nr:MAG: hypothetical protein IPK84_02215 [Candidatus Moranbacteria bacterium]